MNEQAFFNLDTNAEPEKDVRERIFFLNSMLNKHGIWFDLVYDSEGSSSWSGSIPGC